jgi:hypothetical protein
MSEFFGSPHALLVLVLAGFLPNEVWRMAGLWFGDIASGRRRGQQCREQQSSSLAPGHVSKMMRPPECIYQRAISFDFRSGFNRRDGNQFLACAADLA